jgi:hypothetical protein
VRTDSTNVDGEDRSATFGGDHDQYRYSLTRRWGEGPLLPWVMLNPSTADAMKDDATIRRVRGFTKRVSDELAREPLGGFIVVNLFAWRATNPEELIDVHACGMDPIGPENKIAFEAASTELWMMIGGWGTWPFKASGYSRIPYFEKPYERVTHCFGMNKAKVSSPKHPLYLPRNAPLERWVDTRSDW